MARRHIVPGQKSFFLCPKPTKTNSIIQKNPNFLKACRRLQMHPNAFECVPAGPNRSEWVRTHPETLKTFENIEKTCKNFEKLHEIFCQKIQFYSKQI